MDRLTPEQRSAQMSRIRGTNTRPELVVRRLVHHAGFRFRLHRRISAVAQAQARRHHPDVRLPGGKLPGRPDLVFSGQRKVVFVNGCFWHQHGCRAGRHAPTTNAEFWARKLQTNRERDARNHSELHELGCSVLDVWECELEDADVVLSKLVAFLDGGGSGTPVGDGDRLDR